ncbi:hypothetical protein OG413_39970 [Streptomyces sp. NBC_01433]|uniref:hypothetical protein n=1 Tax=Streptomyces sp. NBC_01433 TaxID=2903864 RepID=UPI00224DD24B|nr:hypothetical protein [Streptomyces sp. NBC_01433]MCX4681376.1 hypothetical protein [Streptomyces sp. NBC_01433]
MSIATSAASLHPAVASAASPSPAPAQLAPTVTAMSATTAPSGTRTRKKPRYPQIPALAGNANVRALLAHGIHPASRQPLADTPGTDCGTCTLFYRLQLPIPDGDSAVQQRFKCAIAPVSCRGRQGIDLRPTSADQPGTPACTLHCTHTDWPFDPEGHGQSAADAIGHAEDHPDERGVYAKYRVFGFDLEHQRLWVELEAEMIPNPAADGGRTQRVPQPQRSRPDKPHLYRFWTPLNRLHTAHITHPRPDGAGTCAHPLVRSGRVRLSPPAA